MKDFIELHDTNNDNQPVIIAKKWIATVETIDSKTRAVRLSFIRDIRDNNSRMYEIQAEETYDEIKKMLLIE